ncbi:MAG: hypothetical protein MI743_08205 [Sneathiellales bacterium]|nr:hypothetical protein [Sneathiellales bacterium]
MERLVPCVFFTGYLGAGKTTLINILLSLSTGRRVTVLVNDFGSINIDADLIENQNGETISLSNGCACCTIGDSLIESAEKVLKEFSPDLLVIEASGVAEPNRLKNLLAGVKKIEYPRALSVVNAGDIEKKLADKFVGKLCRQQILEADALYFNRHNPDQIYPLQDKLSVFHVPTFTEAREVMEFILEADPYDRDLDLSLEKTEIEHGLQSVIVECPLSINKSDFDQMLRPLQEICHRIKGFVQLMEKGQAVLHSVQATDTSCELTRIPEGKSLPKLRLVCIGPDLKAHQTVFDRWQTFPMDVKKPA